MSGARTESHQKGTARSATPVKVTGLPDCQEKTLGGGPLAEVDGWCPGHPTSALPRVVQLFGASSMAEGSTLSEANQTAGLAALYC